ncbi:hypothetical protein FA13DRAFT_1758105 [Coprinellus micaceus]|uniref:FHA domain-containing protein n=1 Tax=Coprinellus micaceus TaxID=71717 RepID=A0A4Y7SCY1_COPMI|nr:hypothetical protein FA13DRAFT_1758105 [Coprinellus micaceus]
MATSPPNGTSGSPLPFPALYLYPLNDSFVPKHIALSHGQHVKIGRQTNAKTAPAEKNGYFDSKVLSRQHAEVWEEGGKIYIKDVKSSNGTFINGERLSSEAVESDPYELKSDDIVEFGIDIVGEDNKTIIHHKVAARVVCVFSEQDAAVAGRAEVHAREAVTAAAGPAWAVRRAPEPRGGESDFAGAGRRPQMSQPNLGGLGGGMRPPGKGGLSFDVILSRLQGELQKSRETGAELSTLNGAMGEICDTLAGGLPTNLPPYPSILPSVRPPQEASSPEMPAPVPRSQSPPAPAGSTPAITDLQAQIQETQSTLAAHLEKIRGLEVVLKEQEDMKREVRGLKEVFEAVRERDVHSHHQQQHHRGGALRQGFDLEEEDEDMHDDDDVRSVATVTGHELERVDDEDEAVDMDVDGDEDHSEGGSSQGSASSSRIADKEQEERDEYERREQEAEDAAREEAERRDAEGVGRPGTPEPVLPTSAGKRAVSPLSQSTSSRENTTIASLHASAASVKETEAIKEQLSALTAQVSAVLALTSTLEAQHAAAQDTIRGLEGKVEALESLLRQQIQQQQQAAAPVVEKESTPQPSPPEEKPAEKESLTDRITEWMKNVEGKWNTVQEEWNQERERLGRAREEWESKVRLVDSNLQKLANANASTSAGGYGRVGGVYVNGDVVKHNGLVTPPSPRSQSSDSGRYRRRRRRNREGRRESEEESSGSEEEERSPSPAAGRGEVEAERSVTEVRGKEETSESTAPTSAASSLGVVTGNIIKEKGLPTPDASVYKGAASSAADSETVVDADVGAPVSKVPTAHERNMINLQTAAGVLLLSVAAAAVIWKVKPE